MQIDASKYTKIPLGRQGENMARNIVFDLSDFVAAYGDGVAELIHCRPGDTTPYPVPAVRDGNTLVWTVSNVDTDAPSTSLYGQCELRWYVGDVLVKSRIWRTLVEPAMDTPSETAPPAPEQGWVEQVLSAGAAAAAAADKAEDALSRAPYIGSNGNWYIGTDDSGVPATGPAGKDGKDGAPGADGHTPEYGVDYGTPEQIAGIAQSAAEVLRPGLNQIKDDLSDNVKSDAETRRKLDYLWKLNQGISYQFETDDTEAYQKTVPSGAKLAGVHKIGGKTVVWNQIYKGKDGEPSEPAFKLGISTICSGYEVYLSGVMAKEENSDVNIYFGMEYSAEAVANHKYLYRAIGGIYYGIYPFSNVLNRPVAPASSYTIVTAADNGYIQHSIAPFEGRKIKNGTVVDEHIHISVFDLTKMFGAGNEPISIDDPRIAWIDQYTQFHPEYNAGELVSAVLERVKYNDAVIAEIPESVRALSCYGWSSGKVCNAIERTDTGWQYVQRVGSREYQDGDAVTDGVTTYYALDNPVITDITNLMNGALDAIPVEVGGTLIFDNAAKLPVPSSVDYLISLAEVNG